MEDFKKIDTLMLSLEAQKQKSPQTVDVIEELLWMERTKESLTKGIGHTAGFEETATHSPVSPMIMYLKRYA